MKSVWLNDCHERLRGLKTELTQLRVYMPKWNEKKFGLGCLANAS